MRAGDDDQRMNYRRPYQYYYDFCTLCTHEFCLFLLSISFSDPSPNHMSDSGVVLMSIVLRSSDMGITESGFYYLNHFDAVDFH